MSYRLIILPEARQELVEQAAYYQRELPGLGREFGAQARADIHYIRRLPLTQGYWYRKPLRHRTIGRFPVSVLYLIVESTQEVVVVSVWHQHRNPADLNDRLAPFA